MSILDVVLPAEIERDRDKNGVDVNQGLPNSLGNKTNYIYGREDFKPMLSSAIK